MKQLFNSILKPKRCTIKTLTYLILALSLLDLENLHAQYQGFCATPANMPDFLKTARSLRVVTVSSSYNVGVFFHIMRMTNGTGGQTQQEINTAISTLTSDYQSYNINISLLGTDEIKNDTYYNFNSVSNFVDASGNTDANGDGKFDVFNVNTHPNAIDIYLFADDKLNFGLAANIPGTALVIGGNAFSVNLPSSHVLSHEFGHCLGLFHTFHGTYPYEAPSGSCPELVNGSNGTTCGDYVNDTPADPARIFDCGTQSTCTWNCSSSYTDANGDHYNPNTHLYMAYTFPTCMNQHSSGEVTRMFDMIANSCLLQNTLVMSLTGSNLVCSSGATFTVNNLPAGCTITWAPGPNIQRISPQGSNPCTLSSTGNGLSWIDAVISNSCQTSTLHIPVWSGDLPTPTISGTAVVKCGYDVPFQVDDTSRTYSQSFYWESDILAFYPDDEYRVIASGYVNGRGTISCTVNSCGTPATGYRNVLVTLCDDKIMLLYPNPASDEVRITFLKSKNSSILPDSSTIKSSDIRNYNMMKSYNISIYNQIGIKVSSVNRSGDSFTVPLNNLKDGSYIFEANNGIECFINQLLIKH